MSPSQFAVFIDTLIRDIAMAVILRERAMFFSGFVASFKARAVSHNLDALSFLASRGKIPLELSTACLVKNTLTVHLVILPRTDVLVAVFPSVGSLSFPDVAFPIAGVDCSAFPDKSPLALHGAIHEMTGVLVAIGEVDYTFTGALAIAVLPFINIAFMDLVDATTVLLIVFPFTDIGVTVSIDESAMTMTVVVLPLTVIF